MDNAKKFELLLLKKSSNALDVKKAYPMVEDHMGGISSLKSNCILVGGAAIDFAMRMKGKKLYPDDTLEYNDYDFMNPDAIVDAYKFGMSLHESDIYDVSVINARHMTTMTVIVGGVPIADETYIPKNIFNKVPTLVYRLRRGKQVIPINIVHPLFQIINIHMALSFPYRNPPMEVYNQRISKDISRYNMIWDLYIEEHLEGVPKSPPNSLPITVDVSISEHPGSNLLFAGLLAHANLMTKVKFKSRNICKFENNKLTVTWVEDLPVPVDVYISDIEAEKCGLIATHNRLLDWFPTSHKRTANNITTSLYISRIDLFPMVEANACKYACVQHTLMYFAVQATLADFGISQIWWNYYYDCINALNELCTSPNSAVSLFGTDVWPNRETISISESSEYWTALTAINIRDGIDGPADCTDKSNAKKFLDKKPSPANYSSHNIKNRMVHLLQWDNSSEYFQIDGNPIKHTNS